MNHQTTPKAEQPQRLKFAPCAPCGGRGGAGPTLSSDCPTCSGFGRVIVRP